MRINSAVMQIIQQFLDIKGIALGAAGDACDEERRHGTAALGKELGELCSDGLFRFRSIQLREAELGKVIQSFQNRVTLLRDASASGGR